MLQTLEPTWTLQGAPVGRLFVSSKGDLARIVGLVSQSMQQMPNTRGRWAADVLLFHRAHRRVNHGLLPHWPAPSHSRRGSCRFVTLECFGLAFCLLPLHKLWHISHPQETECGVVEGMARPPHQACMQLQPALSRPLVRRLHDTPPDHLRPLVTTITTQVLGWPSHSMMTERAHQPIFQVSHPPPSPQGGLACLSAPALPRCDEAHIGICWLLPKPHSQTEHSSVLSNQLGSIYLGGSELHLCLCQSFSRTTLSRAIYRVELLYCRWLVTFEQCFNGKGRRFERQFRRLRIVTGNPIEGHETSVCLGRLLFPLLLLG